MTLITIRKKIPTQCNSTPSEGSIATEPVSAVLGPIHQLDAANNNAPSDEGETPKFDGTEHPPTQGLDGLPGLPDEVVLDDSGLPIETAEREEFVGATTTEPGDLPGIVDEGDDDDDPRFDQRLEVELTEDFCCRRLRGALRSHDPLRSHEGLLVWLEWLLLGEGRDRPRL